MEFLRSFLRHHLAGKPVVASPNVDCFLRLSSSIIIFSHVHSNASCILMCSARRECEGGGGGGGHVYLFMITLLNYFNIYGFYVNREPQVHQFFYNCEVLPPFK